MTKNDRDIQRKLRILRHAEQIGDVSRTCRYFGIGRASFYRWKSAFQKRGEVGCEFRFNPAGYSDLMPATIPI